MGKGESKCSKYWKEEEKKCRLCKRREETLEHIFKECEFTRGSKKMIEILDKKRPDVKEMRRILEIRKKEAEREER